MAMDIVQNILLVVFFCLAITDYSGSIVPTQNINRARPDHVPILLDDADVNRVIPFSGQRYAAFNFNLSVQVLVG
jgi:hypothetical protein